MIETSSAETNKNIMRTTENDLKNKTINDDFIHVYQKYDEIKNTILMNKRDIDFMKTFCSIKYSSVKTL